MVQRTCIRLAVSVCFALLSTVVWGQCGDEFPLSNTEGAGQVMCPCFVAGEEAGVVLEEEIDLYEKALERQIQAIHR